MSHFDFSNRKIVIAGASSGIGKETAKELSRQGASLVLLARRTDELKMLASELQGENRYYGVDLSDLAQIETIVKKIIEENGRIDGLLYAAGKHITLPIAHFTPERVEEIFRINFFGFIETVRQFCKKGRFNSPMTIVGISSIASKCGDKTNTIYSATKAAMDAAIRCLAKELAVKGIRINSIAPGMTNTDIYKEYYSKYGDKGKEDLINRQYLGIANPEEIANSIVFLLSEASSFITGSTLMCDGGYTTC